MDFKPKEITSNTGKPKKTLKEYSNEITQAMINNELFKGNFVNRLLDKACPFTVKANLDTITVDGKKYMAALISHVGMPNKDISEEKQVEFTTLVIFNDKETYVQMINTQPTRWYNYLRNIKRNKQEFIETLDSSFYPLRANKYDKARNISQLVYG